MYYPEGNNPSGGGFYTHAGTFPIISSYCHVSQMKNILQPKMGFPIDWKAKKDDCECEVLFYLEMFFMRS